MATVLYQQDELFEGFTIRFEALPECESIEDICVDMEESYRETFTQDIRCGRTVLFIARVTARRAGIELAETFLGGCTDENYADFIDEEGYYSHARRKVISEAKIKIRLLQEPDSKKS